MPFFYVCFPALLHSLFLSYARQWWRDFLSIRPSHSSRLVKVFARSHSALALPVSSFVRPIALNRLIDTPRMVNNNNNNNNNNNIIIIIILFDN